MAIINGKIKMSVARICGWLRSLWNEVILSGIGSIEWKTVFWLVEFMLHLPEPPDIPPLKSQPYWKIHRLPNRSHCSQKRLGRPTAIVRASGKTPAAVWGQPDWLLGRMNSCMQIWMVAKGKTLSNQPDYSTNIINEAEWHHWCVAQEHAS